MPTGVIVRDNESFEQALRRFKRKCEKSGILSEVKRRRFYEKPSDRRKREMIQARKKMLRKLAKQRRARPDGRRPLVCRGACGAAGR